MRIIAQSTLVRYGAEHSDVAASLRPWINRVRPATWRTTAEIQAAFPKAEVLNRERVRFPVGGGGHRLIAAFDFSRGIVFIKFVGTHAEYDRVDALTIAQL